MIHMLRFHPAVFSMQRPVGAALSCWAEQYLPVQRNRAWQALPLRDQRAFSAMPKRQKIAPTTNFY